MSHSATDNEDQIELGRDENKAIRQRSLRLLGSLLSPHKKALAIAAGLVMLSSLGQVAGPWLVGWTIDNALMPLMEDGDTGPLTFSGLTYLAAAVIGGLAAGAYIRQAARIAQGVMYDLRRRVFRQTQRLSLEFHEKYTSGRVISRQTSDMEALRELLDGGLTGVISSMFLMVFIAGTIVFTDLGSAGILALAFIPSFFLTRWFQKKSQLFYREQRTASARLIVKFVETMTGMRAVQAFRRESTTERDFGNLSNSYREAFLKVFSINGRFQPGLVVIGNLTVVVALAVGAWRVIEGDLGAGTLVAVLLLVKRFFQPIQQIGMFYNSFQSATAALEKVSGLLAEEPTVVEPKNPAPLENPRGDLRLSSVKFRYGSGPVVLPHMDLHIPAGQTVALVGTTGAGKSTLAKLVTRFYDASEGTISLDGVDLREISTDDLRNAVVMVTQEAYLFSGSVRENIALGKPGATDEEIVAAAQAVGAHEFILKMPEGYDTEVNKRGGRVSAGQKQLLSFARAFLADPAVLVLDEATASLDLPGERIVQHGLQTLLADRTAIIIAHRLSTVAIADRVLVMAHGEVTEDGTPEELLAAGGTFADLNQAWEDSLV
ncbi:ABC transporter ATP-binding protein [Bogoriella caseilytica]|uniref:ATP-binding cassette subfamily B protein n=1 Tax=Bogoriella caseilytica TaxID=56055 RepID=A0A3N2BHA5_9MICO|nr:ABC transporter ATP-binding protein [Bogoriella caseilytica]ROR74454.1 ATP-binding cassette subfamily B protein [Bogoriella caseilytica]